MTGAKAGRPLGRRNIRSYMAAEELERLNLNPIEEALNCIKELDEVIALNVKAFKDMRGYSEKSDQGSAYLANAIRAISDKSSTYMALARFKYPVLSAVAIKDLGADNQERKPLTTAEAVAILAQDPFNPSRQNNVIRQAMEVIPICNDKEVMNEGLEGENPAEDSVRTE